MLDETFYLDGIDANSVGIKLQSPVEFSEAIPVFESQTVPGRNGDLIFETGSYKNRVGSASCFCLQKDVETAISSAGRFLMCGKGYRRLETSDDPDHYWMARVKNSPQIAMRLRTLAPFEIKFDCKPQRFVKSGENAVVFTANGSISNQYGQVALPLITLYGQGTGILKIGDCAIGIKELDGVLFLDSDTQNAYNDNGNQNMNINAKIFPTLPSGDTQIAFKGGIDRVEIVPRWWEL